MLADSPNPHVIVWIEEHKIDNSQAAQPALKEEEEEVVTPPPSSKLPQPPCPRRIKPNASLRWRPFNHGTPLKQPAWSSRRWRSLTSKHR